VDGVAAPGGAAANVAVMVAVPMPATSTCTRAVAPPQRFGTVAVTASGAGK
jgi:hypothetical protein